MQRTIVVTGDDQTHSGVTREQYRAWRTAVMARSIHSVHGRMDVIELSALTGAWSLEYAFSAPDEASLRAAVNIVRLHVEEHGADAARHLDELAAGTTDRYDRLNYARAASALAAADPVKLRRAQIGSLRARYGMPKSDPRRTPRAPRRRRA